MKPPISEIWLLRWFRNFPDFGCAARTKKSKKARHERRKHRPKVGCVCQRASKAQTTQSRAAAALWQKERRSKFFRARFVFKKKQSKQKQSAGRGNAQNKATNTNRRSRRSPSPSLRQSRKSTTRWPRCSAWASRVPSARSAASTSGGTLTRSRFVQFKKSFPQPPNSLTQHNTHNTS